VACIGCPIATFHTVDDACREHGIDRDKFLAVLRDCVPA
jgi:hybrid cluster-associated redox disulfide protein